MCLDSSHGRCACVHMCASVHTQHVMPTQLCRSGPTQSTKAALGRHASCSACCHVQTETLSLCSPAHILCHKAESRHARQHLGALTFALDHGALVMALAADASGSGSCPWLSLQQERSQAGSPQPRTQSHLRVTCSTCQSLLMPTRCAPTGWPAGPTPRSMDSWGSRAHPIGQDTARWPCSYTQRCWSACSREQELGVQRTRVWRWFPRWRGE